MGDCSKDGSGKDGRYMYIHIPSSINTSTSITTMPTTTTATTTNFHLHYHPHQTPKLTKGKWVKNLSSRPLTKTEVSLLARGPNFAVVSLYSPKREYIAAEE